VKVLDFLHKSSKLHSQVLNTMSLSRKEFFPPVHLKTTSLSILFLFRMSGWQSYSSPLYCIALLGRILISFQNHTPSIYRNRMRLTWVSQQVCNQAGQYMSSTLWNNFLTVHWGSNQLPQKGFGGVSKPLQNVCNETDSTYAEPSERSPTKPRIRQQTEQVLSCWYDKVKKVKLSP
jgi:hypothetical protein